VKNPVNIPASVRQRLLNRARRENRPFGELLQYYAMERFLYRLSRSDHAESFILKGAMMLRIWNLSELRSTMDIDLLGRTRNDEVNIITCIREILSVEVPQDGLTFEPDTIKSEQITGEADYPGIRIRFRGKLDTARVHMQLDIGFGDIVYPEPEAAELPAMLDFPSPSLLCYCRETVIAEKFEAMVKLGALNSRMKDFYDIWLLSRQFEFDIVKLTEAIRLTFNQRGTVIPAAEALFDRTFVDTKQPQWAAFRKRLQQEHVPASFQEVVIAIEKFLIPVVSGLER